MFTQHIHHYFLQVSTMQPEKPVDSRFGMKMSVFAVSAVLML